MDELRKLRKTTTGEYISPPKLRHFFAASATETILQGCIECGADAIFLYYTNAGYGEPYWIGYCRTHSPARFRA